MALQIKWDKLATSLKTNDPIDSDTWARWWQFVSENYTSEQRKYHTLRHLSELLWHLDRAQEKGWVGKRTNRRTVHRSVWRTVPCL